MNDAYAPTTSLCRTCAADVPAHYEKRIDGIVLLAECPNHGTTAEYVERDEAFWQAGMEREYAPVVRHLALPVTYRCGLRCRYCYALSNGSLHLPPDRSIERLVSVAATFDGNVTLIGGEPTIRDDLPELVARVKAALPKRAVSVATNGIRLTEPGYIESLRDAGMDFIFLSLNDVAYEPTHAAHRRKLEALVRCSALRLPVWLQRTIDDEGQIASLPPLIEQFRKVIFMVTLRSAQAFGASAPPRTVCVSAMLAQLGCEHGALPGTTPFNRIAFVHGRRVKVCSWVCDSRRVDPLDSAYLVSDERMTTFHRGMRIDEVLLRRRAASPEAV